MEAPAAFVLAAGLGTRLAPLTDLLPKPLIPLFHKPLLTFALDSLIAAGVGTLALNTHHLPGAFHEHFGAIPTYRDRPLSLFHEPLLLDTGGGIRNARQALGSGTFLVYNGDILGDLPLTDLLAQHKSSGSLATLLLRPTGGKANVRLDESSGLVLDLREELGRGEGREVVYSGIAAFEPAILDWIPTAVPFSVIDALLAALRSGERVGGMLCQEGLWIDLGTPAAYLDAHRLLADPAFRPSYVEDRAWPCPIHPKASIASSAMLGGMVAAGPGAVVGEGAHVCDSILWPGAVIAPGSWIEGCIVSGRSPVSGSHAGGVL